MARASAVDRLVPTPDGRLFTRRWPAAQGTGSAPVVLFHDSVGCVDLWRGLPAALAQATGRDVVAYDRIGFGRSDAASRPLAPDFVAAEAASGFAALREALGIGPFVALGHSVGGGMALFAGAACPEDCRAVVTIAAQAWNDDRIRAGIRAAKAGFALPGQLDRLARHHGDKARWVLDSWTETWLSPDFDGFTVAPARTALCCPVLAIHGEDDEYGEPAHAVAVAGADGQLALLPGRGHFPHREDEAGIVALIARFLSPNC